MASYEIDRIQFGDNVYRLKDTFREYLEETETPEEASGSPAVIDRPWPTVIDALAVAIRPKRDLHGFEAPWPGGAGKNLFAVTTVDGNDDTATVRNVEHTIVKDTDGNVMGVRQNGTSSSASNGYCFIGRVTLPAGTYVVSCFGAVSGVSGLRIGTGGSGDTGAQGTYVAMSYEASPYTLTLDSETVVSLAVSVPAGGTIPNALLQPMITRGSAAPAAFEPWENKCALGGFGTVAIGRTGQEDGEEPDEVFEVSLPDEAGTVYGGTLTVNADGSGTLTVNRAVLTVGNITWTENANYDRFQGVLPGILRGPVRGVYIMSSLFTPCADQRALADVEPGMIYSAGTQSDNCYVKRVAGESLSEFTAKYAGVAISYILATPAVYSLTAPQVRTVTGYNAFASEAGDVTVQFRADRLAGASATAAATAAETLAVIDEYGAS